LIGVLGLDQHEVGAVTVARMLRDARMEVIYAGRFNLPSMIVKTAIQEDVDVIGLSLHSWEYIHYLPELMRLLRESSLKIPVITGGSIITKADREFLKAIGVAAVFGPSATRSKIEETIKALVNLNR
jgi:methylmalonyl-CoA mutase C-terminal domain/subunit